jgi:tetratricopeptide (TPR) repeat protein
MRRTSAKLFFELPGACALALIWIGSTSVFAQGDPLAGLVGSKVSRLSLVGLDGRTLECPPPKKPETGLRLLIFWANWSEPSLRELDLLKKLWKIWSKRGVDFLAVNVEAPKLGEKEIKKVEVLWKKKDFPFPLALDDGLGAFRAFGIVAVPTTLVIDDQERILMRMSGFPITTSSKLIRLVESRLRSEEKVKGRPLLLETLPHRRSARLLRMARVMWGKGRLDMAEYSLKRAVQEDPSQVAAYSLLISLYRKMGKAKEAESLLSKAQDRFPKESLILLEAAKSALGEGEGEKAIALVEKALKVNPAYVPSLLLKGEIQRSMGNLPSALESYRRASRRNPLNPAPILEMAKTLEKLGRKEEAFGFYKQAFDLLHPGGF